MCALRRDSTVTEEELDEHQIGQLYESQLVQLEKLIAVQRRSHMRAKSVSHLIASGMDWIFSLSWVSRMRDFVASKGLLMEC